MNMKTTQQTTYVPNNGNLKIPSREEFHKYPSSLLYESLFCTEHPSNYTIDNIHSAIRWAEKLRNRGK